MPGPDCRLSGLANHALAGRPADGLRGLAGEEDWSPQRLSQPMQTAGRGELIAPQPPVDEHSAKGTQTPTGIPAIFLDLPERWPSEPLNRLDPRTERSAFRPRVGAQEASPPTQIAIASHPCPQAHGSHHASRRYAA
jgi:hypothetical protein